MEFKEATRESGGSKEKSECIQRFLCDGGVGNLVFPVEVDVLLEMISNNSAKESADLAIMLKPSVTLCRSCIVGRCCCDHRRSCCSCNSSMECGDILPAD